MNSALLKRSTFVLSRETAEQLDMICARMGVSRSALVRDVLAEPVQLMAKWVSQLPEQPTREDARAVLDTMGRDLDLFLERQAGQLSLLDAEEAGNA